MPNTIWQAYVTTCKVIGCGFYWDDLSGKSRVRSAECGVWKIRSVENEECGKCGVWKMRSVENAECGECGVWKMRSVENEECRGCGVWKMQSVENAECRKCGVWKMRSVKEKNKVISPHVGITPSITPPVPSPLCRP